MKIWAWGAAVGSVVALVACGGSNTGNTGGMGTGGSTNTTVTSTGTHSTTTTSTMTGMGGTGGTSACGSLQWDTTNTDCNQCMLDNCCDQLAACDTGTQCGSVVACANACASGDSACVKACEDANPTGNADLQTLLMCYDNSCKTTAACGTKICDSGLTIPDATCGGCLDMKCCDSFKACAQDQTCLGCITTSPPDPSCATNALAKAATDCQKNSCTMECASGICDSGLTTQNGPCDYCLGNSCCMPIDACKADQACLACLSNSMGAGCSTNAKYQAVQTCWSGNCSSACGG